LLLDQDRGPAWKPAKAEVVSSLNIVIYLFSSINAYLDLPFIRLPEKRDDFVENHRGTEFEPKGRTRGAVSVALKFFKTDLYFLLILKVNIKQRYETNRSDLEKKWKAFDNSLFNRCRNVG